MVITASGANGNGWPHMRVTVKALMSSMRTSRRQPGTSTLPTLVSATASF